MRLGETDATCTAARGALYIVSVGAQLPEGLDEEPRAFVARPVQRHPHGVLLQQRRQPLVHRQVLVALHVQELRRHNAV